MATWPPNEEYLMVYFIVIAAVVFVGGGIGVGFWVASERKKRYSAEKTALKLRADLEGAKKVIDSVEEVIDERDKEIVRLRFVIDTKTEEIGKLEDSLVDNVDHETASDLFDTDIAPEEVF